jgi:hypothetical protein
MSDDKEDNIEALNCGIPVVIAREVSRAGARLVAIEEIPDFGDEEPTHPALRETGAQVMDTIATSDRPTVRMRPITREDL